MHLANYPCLLGFLLWVSQYAVVESEVIYLLKRTQSQITWDVFEYQEGPRHARLETHGCRVAVGGHILHLSPATVYVSLVHVTCKTNPFSAPPVPIV